jgi:hypothetical protein
MGRMKYSFSIYYLKEAILLKYQIKTPNPKYKGETLGVKFEDGLGLTEEKDIKNALVQEYGYEEVASKAKPKSDKD